MFIISSASAHAAHSRRQLHLLPFFQEAEVPIPERGTVTLIQKGIFDMQEFWACIPILNLCAKGVLIYRLNSKCFLNAWPRDIKEKHLSTVSQKASNYKVEDLVFSSANGLSIRWGYTILHPILFVSILLLKR